MPKWSLTDRPCRHYTVYMSQPAPGKHFRQGMSLVDLLRMFPDNEAAEKWFIDTRWPNGIACHYCGSTDVQVGCKHKTMPFRCREKGCAKRFSVRTGTVMQSSKLGFQVWAIAIYLMSTNLKGISSMKLHRELDITQKSAWHLAHRLRDTLRETRTQTPMLGPVEADETYIGGKAKNMHGSKWRQLSGRGGVGKIAVAGIKDRASNNVSAVVIPNVKATTLMPFVTDRVHPDAMVYTDDSGSYNKLPSCRHQSVNHSAGEYVRKQAHTNGIESFWAMLKRGYVGTYHQMSPEHLDRYVGEFKGRHNARCRNTIDQMNGMVRGAEGKRLRYADLINHKHGQRAHAV